MNKKKRSGEYQVAMSREAHQLESALEAWHDMLAIRICYRIPVEHRTYIRVAAVRDTLRAHRTMVVTQFAIEVGL